MRNEYLLNVKKGSGLYDLLKSGNYDFFVVEKNTLVFEGDSIIIHYDLERGEATREIPRSKAARLAIPNLGIQNKVQENANDLIKAVVEQEDIEANLSILWKKQDGTLLYEIIKES